MSNSRTHIMRLTLACWISLLSLAAVYADPAFKQGNAHYKAGCYADATTAYLAAIRAEGENSITCYNLGNAYYKLKDYPKAVLYYEKALKHDPSDERAAFNLDMARDKALTKIERESTFFVIRFLGDLIHGYGARAWSLAMLITLWFGALSMVRYFRKEPGQGNAYRAIGFTALFFAAACFLVARHRYTEQTGQTHAVVLQQQAELKAEPVQAAKTTTRIEAGNTVELLDRDAGWYKVELPNGKTGWLAVKDVAPV